MPVKSPSTALPATIWNIPELAAPVENMAKYFFGSTPILAQAASASAVSDIWPIAAKLLTSLILCPAPRVPTWKMFSQNAFNAGSISAKVASSAPTIVLSRPCSASTGVRASGAST